MARRTGQVNAEPVVWLVEDSVPRQVEGTFPEWLEKRAEKLDGQLSRMPDWVSELTEEERQDEFVLSLDELT